MKSPTIRPVHKKKEPTTNYAGDTHKEFCKRCFARNGVMFCPRDKHGWVDIRECSL